MAELRVSNLNPADSRIAETVFEFVQFLLDDDVNLTPAGNLTGAARQKLRTRIQELMAAETLPEELTARESADSAEPTEPRGEP